MSRKENWEAKYKDLKEEHERLKKELDDLYTQAEDMEKILSDPVEYRKAYMDENKKDILDILEDLAIQNLKSKGKWPSLGFSSSVSRNSEGIDRIKPYTSRQGRLPTSRN